MIMRYAQDERIHDEMERESIIAIMHGNATNTNKRISATDLYKRPTGAMVDDGSMADKKAETKRTNEWLANLTTNTGRKEGDIIE